MSNMTHLIRADLRDFAPYSSARREATQGTVWLNANEMPWDNKVEPEALCLNRYPEQQPDEVNKQLAKLFKVEPDQLVLTRGSDEAIDLLVRLFCAAGKDSTLICPPTFGMYAISTKLQGASLLEVPLIKNEGFKLDVDAIIQKHTSNTKIIFLCSPNNPTGNLVDNADVKQLCEHFANKSIIVVDEAYIEFAHTPSASELIKQFPNLVVLRTLSKAYGLAGARCGLFLAQAELVQWLRKVMAPYPVPLTTVAAIAQTLNPQRLQAIQQQIAIIKTERVAMYDALKDIAFVKQVWPSEANYLLVEVADAKKFMQETTAQGIVLRDMSSKPELANCVRISIGLAEENQRVINILRGLS